MVIAYLCFLGCVVLAYCYYMRVFPVSQSKSVSKAKDIGLAGLPATNAQGSARMALCDLPY